MFRRILETELQLSEQYNVFVRPVTQACSLTPSKLEKLADHMDFIRCDYSGRVHCFADALHLDPRFENATAMLERLSRLRESMHPKPYFRLGTVLTNHNYAAFPDFFIWAHESLGVDDVEIVDISLSPAQFNGNGNVLRDLNAIMSQVAHLATSKKYKLRANVFRMQVPGENSSLAWNVCNELQMHQKRIGYVPPRDLDQMSYIIRNQRNRQDYGPYGFVFSNQMKRKDICSEAFTSPYVTPNGNVEACGNCNTILLGNLKHLNFSEIWNSELYRNLRRTMYENPIQSGWFSPCKSCSCNGLKFDYCETNNATYYRITNFREQREHRLSVEETQVPIDWPDELPVADYCRRLEEFKYYPVVIPKENVVYLSDIDPLKEPVTLEGFGTDKIDTFTPITLSGKRYIKGLYTEAYCMITYQVPIGTQSFEAVIGLFDAENPSRHIQYGYPGLEGEAVFKVLVNGKNIFCSGCLTAASPGEHIILPIESDSTITLVAEHGDPAKTGGAWAVWADAHFSRLPPKKSCLLC